MANDLDLDFISVIWETYDIALPGDALGAAKPLITALRDATVQASIQRLGGYDLAESGILEPLSGPITTLDRHPGRISRAQRG